MFLVTKENRKETVKVDAVRPYGIVMYDYKFTPLRYASIGVCGWQSVQNAIIFERRIEMSMVKLEVLCDASTLLWKMGGIFDASISSRLYIANNRLC